jgi:hypothetical protein
VASKSAYREGESKADIEELLEVLEKSVDRLRNMYEQYFLGIAKTAPGHFHTDCERKLRDLSQIQIRNTALRYRFATLQQKFGAYNNYWRRTVRQIEQGTYVRSLSKVKRKVMAEGGEIPEEILAAMPKIMREQVRRERDAAVQAGKRRGKVVENEAGDYGLAEVDLTDDINEDTLDVAEITSPRPKLDADEVYAAQSTVHHIDMDELESMDIESLLDDLVAPDVTRRATKTAEAMRSAPRATTQPGPPTPAAAPPAAAPARAAHRGPHTVQRQPQKMPSIPSPPPGTIPPPRAATQPGAPHPQAPPPRAAQPQVPSRVQTQPLGRAGEAGRPAPVTGPTVPLARPQAQPRPAAAAGLPPGMTEGDVRTLYQKYAKAREMVGERNDDQTYQQLLRTLHQQAPKIMAQYKAKGVEFGVVIKDNQVVLKAKPK